MTISFDDFTQLDLRIGTIQEVSVIEDADKLLLLSVSLGEEERQIIAGIRNMIEDTDELVDTQVVVVANMEPKEMFGYESQGMILAARGEEDFSLVTPNSEVADGSVVK